MRSPRLQKFVTNANGFILAIANVVVSAIAGYIGHLLLGGSLPGVEPQVTAEFVGFYGFVISCITFIALYVLEFDMKMREEFAGFSQRLHNVEYGKNTIECVGTAFKLFDHRFQDVLEVAANATSVRNTLVFHYTNNATEIEAALDDYLKEGGPRRLELLTTVLKQRNDWVEIFSRNAARKFDTHIREVKARTNAAFYRPLVLKKGYPVVNFAIFNGRVPEVWFGFGLFTDNLKGNVFRSRNAQLIGYFDTYFSELLGGCTEWSGIDQESFYGTWITAVYQDNKLRDCGRLTIHAERNLVVVKGEIYTIGKKTGKFKHLNDFISSEQTKCVLDNGNLKLQFEVINDTSVATLNRRVECCYEILNFNKPDCFIGTAKVNLATPIEIFGRKLNEAGSRIASTSTNAETARFLHSLFTRGDIRSTPPLPNQSPFSGSSFG